MPIELYPSVAKIKRNGVYENLPGFVPETGSVATQQMIATAESSATAQYVHNKGEYFRLNDTLYQAIVKINVGDSIVVGTNCEVAVIGNDLTHVANSIANYELGIATSSHNTGDYFMVGEIMYVATADIQVGDNISTSTNCRKAVVGDELSGLKTALNYFGKDMTINFIDGGYIKTDIATGITVNTPVVNSGYRYAVAECEYGDWCEIHTNGAGAARAFAFVDANGARLAAASSNTNIDRVYIAPPNAKYLVLNDKIADTDYSAHVGIGIKQQRNIDNIVKNAEYKIASQLPINPVDLQFEQGTYTTYADDTAYYFTYPSAATNRIRSCPNAWIFLPKGTKITTDGTTQFYCIIKKLDGTFANTSWSDSLTSTKDAYYLFSIKNANDSDIASISVAASTLTIEAPSYAQKTVNNSWVNKWFFDVSHRGYKTEAPESTLAAFCRAKAKGYNGIECDLRITSDGEFVVHHNSGMPSNSSYLIADHTLAELRTNANMGSYQGITQQILTFDDLVKLSKDLDFTVFVELKATFTTAQIAEIIGIAAKYDMKNRIYWMASYNSENFDYVGNFRTVDANCNILVYDTTTASNIAPFVVEGKNITFCYARVTYITSTVVQNMANIGVDTLAWCVTFSWLLPDYTLEQVKQKIYDTLDCGVRGMCLDKWTTAELIRMRYSDYFD